MNKRSEEILQGIDENYLRMPYSKMLWLRLEFMVICGDEIEALIMRVMEYEIEGVRHLWLRKAQDLAAQGKTIPEEPEHWWISLSYKQFMVRLYGVVKNKKTIIDKLNKLTNDKHLLLRRNNPDNEFGAPQYTINKKIVQDKLNELPSLSPLKVAAKSVENEAKAPIPAGGTPDEEVDDPYQQVVHPVPVDGTPHTSSYHTPVPVDGTDPYQQVVPVNNSKNSNNQKETPKESDAIANAIRYTHPVHSFLFFDDLMKPTTMIISLTSKQFESEMEDDSRYRIAGEIEHELALKGFSVEVLTTHDSDDKVVDSQATEKTSTQVVQPTLLPEKETRKTTPNGKGEKPVQKEKPAPIVPTMPPMDAPWPSSEVAVQIIEFKIGKQYRETARAKELTYARRMFKEDPELTREDFIKAYDRRNDEWWKEHQGILHLHHMVEKDRIHEMLDRIVVEEQKKSRQKSGNGQQPQFYAAAALKARAQRDIQPTTNEAGEDTEERLSEAELAAYMRLVK